MKRRSRELMREFVYEILGGILPVSLRRKRMENAFCGRVRKDPFRTHKQTYTKHEEGSKMLKRLLLAGMMMPILIMGIVASSVIQGQIDNTKPVYKAKLTEISPFKAEIKSAGPTSSQPDTIRYDNNFVGSIATDPNTYIAVRFTPRYDLTLYSIYFAIWNEYNNTTTGCNLYVTADNGYGKPIWPATYVGTISAPLPNATWIQFDLAGPIAYSAGNDFHVIYGPAPGGTYPGTGWWVAFDNDSTFGERSNISLDNGNTWLTVINGDAFIRAGGIYSTPAGQDTLSWKTLSSPNVNFGSEPGDSLAVWFDPPAPCQLLAVRLMPDNFEGNILVDVFETPYDGNVTSVNSVDENGRISGSTHPLMPFSSPLGDRIVGPIPKTIGPADAGKWIEVGIPFQPDMGGEPFCIAAWTQRTAGWGFSAEDEGILPFNLFKHYSTTAGPDGVNTGWFLRRQSLYVEAIVDYGEEFPPDFHLVGISGGWAPWTRLLRLEIDSNGNGSYSIMYPEDRDTGTYTLLNTFNLNPSQLQSIYYAIMAHGFFGLDNLYMGEKVDGSFCDLTVTAGGTTHQVVTSNMAVSLFDRLILDINAETPGDLDLIYNEIFPSGRPKIPGEDPIPIEKTVVYEKDCVIHVDLYIEFYGPAATQALANAWEQNIEDVWNNGGNNLKYGCCPECGCPVVFNVITKLRKAGDPATANYHQINVINDPSATGDGEISAVNVPLPQPNGNSGSGEWDNNEPNNTAAHEAGHLMGLDDQYTVVSDDPYITKPNPGHANDIMADLGGKAEQWAIDEIVQDAGVDCPWWCCCCWWWLLVSDMGESPYMDCYTMTLDSLGYFYDIYVVPSGEDGPPSEILAQYDGVIWACGDNKYSTLSTNDVLGLQSYLDGGGNLFITGQYLGSSIWETEMPDPIVQSFYTKYLHANYVQDIVQMGLLDGESFFNDFADLSILDGDCADNQLFPSEIDPLEPAFTIFRYSNPRRKASISSGTAALAVNTDTYRVVYFGFGFEGIDRLALRNSIMEAMLNWITSFSSCEKGDVDCDGNVSVLDVLAVINHILATIPITDPGALDRADCNCDGQINVLDALGIVNKILGIGECEPGACKSEVTTEVMEMLKSVKSYLPVEDFERFMALVKAEVELPANYSLSRNYPNPFNPVTTIEYSLPEPTKVQVQIYNILGQVVDVLVNSEQGAGYHTILWDASDVASGVYFYRLTAGEFTATKRMVLMK